MVDTPKGLILYDTGKLVITPKGARVYDLWCDDLYPLRRGRVSLAQKEITRAFWEEKTQTDEYKEWFGDMHYEVVNDLYLDFKSAHYSYDSPGLDWIDLDDPDFD